MAYDLKNKEEVELYLKNLNIEYKFGCLSEKNPEVCHLLGDFLESINKDFKGAAQTYKENCDERKYALSCRKYGNYAFIGKGLDKELWAESYDYLTKGCDLGDQLSCLNAGVVSTTTEKDGKPVEPMDFKKGITLLERSCTEHGLERACFYLSSVYLQGVPGHVERNFEEAYRVSVKGCELGNPQACAYASLMTRRGDGVEANPDLAEAFKQRALALQKALRNAKHIPFQQGAGS
ncbi:cytochrome c oxidase assembly factor 7 homolog [Athalia rosae]|uniref:cytochrome c oxidase assembly factor 7 homolog n=1 Tax=Athalia rosae TaxID=37344 RepID=UPI0020345E93|nr:cytochrome c oxidase assembly factor 7 homolog [Athalia rosae]